MERTHKMIEPRPTTISEDFTSDGARPSTTNPWSSRIFIPQTSKILSEPRQQVEARPVSTARGAQETSFLQPIRPINANDKVTHNY